MFRKKEYISSSSLSALAWRRFKKDKLAFYSLIFIAITTIVACLGYLVIPDSTPYSNNQMLELTTKKPGFSVLLLSIKKNHKEKDVSLFSKMFYGEKSEYVKIPIKSYSFEEEFVVVESYTGIDNEKGDKKRYFLADVVFSVDKKSLKYNSEKQLVSYTDIDGRNCVVNKNELLKTIEIKNIDKKLFLLGTDRFGRDMLSQLVIGTRVSLSVGFISVFISLVFGIFLGAVAGFYRGVVDDIIVWFINVVWSIPTLLLVIAITFALGKGFWQVFVAVGLTMWVEVARVVRGQVLSIREKEFVEAGKAMGFKDSRIIFRHILPNVLGVVIVISAANFASAILIEAGLSFLGIGVQPPTPSWGTMIKEHYGYIILDYAYLAIFPGVAIMLMVMAFMLTGNGLRDALDVKTN